MNLCLPFELRKNPQLIGDILEASMRTPKNRVNNDDGDIIKFKNQPRADFHLNVAKNPQ